VPVNLAVPEEAIDPVLIPTGIAIAIWILWRSARIGLEIDDRGIKVRNVFRTYKAGWQDVHEITVFNAHTVGFGGSIGFSVSDGRSGDVITAAATIPGGHPKAREQLMAELRRRAAEYGILFQLELREGEFARPRDAVHVDSPEEARRQAELRPANEVQLGSDEAEAEAPGSWWDSRLARFVVALAIFAPIVYVSTRNGVELGELPIAVAFVVVVIGGVLAWDRWATRVGERGPEPRWSLLRRDPIRRRRTWRSRLSVVPAPLSWQLLQSAWVLPTLTLGLLTWASFVYAGLRAARPLWVLWGVVYLGMVVGLVMAADATGIETIGALGSLALSLVGFAHALLIRQEFLERIWARKRDWSTGPRHA
jgi:hypothetical protein